MSSVGLDLGSATSYIALKSAASNAVKLIENEYSQKMTPSYIGFHSTNRDFGLSAKNNLDYNFKNTVFGIKSAIGKKYAECSEDLKYMQFETCELSKELAVKVNYLNREVVFSATQLAGMMLTKLKTTAEIKLGNEIPYCVISVPTYFTDIQRRSILNAADIAGLTVNMLLNEHTALAISYFYFRQKMFERPKNVVFIDVGHSATTVTATTFTIDGIKIVGSVWSEETGGRSFIEVLVNYFVEDFNRRYTINVLRNPVAMTRLKKECESLLKQMSFNTKEIEFKLENFIESDVCGKISRDVFEQLSSNLLSKISATLMKLLMKTEYAIGTVHECQLVGGLSRMPVITTIVKNIFDIEPLTSLDPEESIAIGNALYRSSLNKSSSFVIEDIQPYCINIVCKKGNLEEKIELFSTFHRIPSSKLVTITYQVPFEVGLYYKNPENPEIGLFSITDFPSDVEIPNNSNVKIKIKFSISLKGILFIPTCQLVVSINNQDSNTEEAMKVVSSFSSETGNSSPEVLYDIPIKGMYYTLTDEEKISWVKEEKNMTTHDLQFEKMKNLYNKIKNYISDSKKKLIKYLKNHITGVDFNHLSELLQTSENWLNEKTDRTEMEYIKLLQDIEREIEPFIVWLKNFNEAKKALTHFKSEIDIISTSVYKDNFPLASFHDIIAINQILSYYRGFYEIWLGLLSTCKAKVLPVNNSIIETEVEAMTLKVHKVLNKLEEKQSAANIEICDAEEEKKLEVKSNTSDLTEEDGATKAKKRPYDETTE